jgi:hypothetical protein
MNLLGPNAERGYGPVDWSRLSQKRAETSEVTPLNLLGSGGGETKPKEVEAKSIPRAEARARVEQSSTSDLLIRGLVERLPKPDEIWALDDRAKWLRTASSIFGLVYRMHEDDKGEIGVAVTRPGGGSSADAS